MYNKAHQLYVTVVQLGKSLLGSKVIFTVYSQEKKKKKKDELLGNCDQNETRAINE